MASKKRIGTHDDPPDVKLSKFLAYMCRHNAKLTFLKGGFIPVSAILSRPDGQKYTEGDIRRVVANCSLNRYTLKQDPKTGQLLIRANWGHSVKVEGLDLEPILSVDGAPKVVSGTYSESWEEIKTEGLKRFKREHIILFADKLPDSSRDVEIVIDLKKALDDGYKFYKSGSVILCPGNSNGVLPPEYFSEVKQL